MPNNRCYSSDYSSDDDSSCCERKHSCNKCSRCAEKRKTKQCHRKKEKCCNRCERHSSKKITTSCEDIEYLKKMGQEGKVILISIN